MAASFSVHMSLYIFPHTLRLLLFLPDELSDCGVFFLFVCLCFCFQILTVFFWSYKTDCSFFFIFIFLCCCPGHNIYIFSWCEMYIIVSFFFFTYHYSFTKWVVKNYHFHFRCQEWIDKKGFLHILLLCLGGKEE